MLNWQSCQLISAICVGATGHMLRSGFWLDDFGWWQNNDFSTLVWIAKIVYNEKRGNMCPKLLER